MIQYSVNKVDLDVYSLPKTYHSDDYVGQLEGLLPTTTKYHNENFFLSMDVREHRYQQVNIDIFGYMHDTNFQAVKTPEEVFDNSDLFHGQDSRRVVGLMGLLPGYNYLNSLENEVIASSAAFDSNGIFNILKKTTPVQDDIKSEAYEGPPSTKNHFVGMLHGLLPGGTIYHNDDFFLSFASIEHHYNDNIGNLINILDRITTGDKVNPEVNRRFRSDKTDGKVLLGLLGLLPGNMKRVDSYVLDEIVHLSKKLPSPLALEVLGKTSSPDLVNPDAFKSPYTFLRNGDYVGQLHGLLPDFNNKMQYVKYGWDELLEGKTSEKRTLSLNLLDLMTTSKTSGVTVNAHESGHDIIAALMTPSPTMAPTPNPSATPSTSMSPSMTHERFKVAEVDFANSDATANSDFILHNGAEILPAPGVVSNALRIDRDGPYATIPGIDISPSSMPECTLMIGLYLDSISNDYGWVVGNEEGGYDRTILMHDHRFGGGIASAIGYPWSPWVKPHTPTKQWIHVTAVFRQGGESYVFVNGIKSDNSAIGKNDGGKSDLWIGRPKHGGHWTDSWIKEVKVFNTALDDSLVVNYAEDFLKEVTHVPVVCGSSYGGCQGEAQLSNINTSLHAVRCCSEFQRPGWQQNSGCDVWAASELDGMCFTTETYSSANEICASRGARLCTHSELKRDCAAGSGCELDHHMTWSQSPASVL